MSNITLDSIIAKVDAKVDKLRDEQNFCREHNFIVETISFGRAIGELVLVSCDLKNLRESPNKSKRPSDDPS